MRKILLFTGVLMASLSAWGRGSQPPSSSFSNPNSNPFSDSSKSFSGSSGSAVSPLAQFTTGSGGSCHGPRNPPRTRGVRGHGSHNHQGIDLRAPTGTPVVAHASGTVVFAGRYGGYGNVVVIQHNGFLTLYAHLSSFAGVTQGMGVSAGQKIGAVGSTGESSGPHLHFEVREGNVGIPTSGMRSESTATEQAMRSYKALPSRDPLDYAEDALRAAPGAPKTLDRWIQTCKAKSGGASRVPGRRNVPEGGEE